MAIDILLEPPISFNAASRYLPDGKRVSDTTWWRWSTQGVRGALLETVVVGGRRCTTAEAVQRFVERTTAAADGQPAPARTNRQRESAIRRAEAELAAAGI